MLLHDLVRTSKAVAEASGRLAKIGLLAELLRRLAPDEIEAAVGMLSGEPRQGRIGIGYAALRSAGATPAAETPALNVLEVDAAFTQIAAIKGAGASTDRHGRLRDLFRRAKDPAAREVTARGGAERAVAQGRRRREERAAPRLQRILVERTELP